MMVLSPTKIKYDPELNLVYYGTSNSGPWNPAERPGDNLWTTTLFARDPDTGKAKWAYAVNPHELWDHDSIGESVMPLSVCKPLCAVIVLASVSAIALLPCACLAQSSTETQKSTATTPPIVGEPETTAQQLSETALTRLAPGGITVPTGPSNPNAGEAESATRGMRYFIAFKQSVTSLAN